MSVLAPRTLLNKSKLYIFFFPFFLLQECISVFPAVQYWRDVFLVVALIVVPVS